MGDLVRVSLSLEDDLLDKLEGLMKTNGYENRSEFIRDMIRERLVEEEWKGNQEVVGTINVISNHGSSLLRKKLVSLLHDYKHVIMSTTHLHLDPAPVYCIDLVLFKGPSDVVRELMNKIKQMKGILNATISMNSTGHQLG